MMHEFARVMPIVKDQENFRRLSLIDRYRSLLGAYCRQASEAGIAILPFHPERDLKFATLPEERQSQIFDQFASYYHVCATTIQNPEIEDLDSPTMTWWAMREMGLRPPSDLFSQLQKDDIVEIYDPAFVQVFRSFNFFKLSSYSLDEILCSAWYELYERDEKITNRMIELAREVYSGKITGLHTGDFPEHAVIETHSVNRNQAIIRHRFFSPLRSEGGGIYLFNSFKVLNPGEATN